MKKIVKILVLAIMLSGCNKQGNLLSRYSSVIDDEISDQLIEESYFLPIGSIVQLKDLNFPVVIQGLMLKNEQGKEYPFVGSPYPQGFMADEELIYFDKDEIEKVIYLGYLSQPHRELEYTMYQFQWLIDGKVFLEDGYVGFSYYEQDEATEKESKAIKKENDFPIGTTFKYNEEIYFVVIGYPLYAVEFEGGEIGKFYYCVQSPLGIEGSEEYKVRAALSESLEELEIVYEGFKDDNYYRWMKEINDQMASIIEANR